MYSVWAVASFSCGCCFYLYACKNYQANIPQTRGLVCCHLKHFIAHLCVFLNLSYLSLHVSHLFTGDVHNQFLLNLHLNMLMGLKVNSDENHHTKMVEEKQENSICFMFKFYLQNHLFHFGYGYPYKKY